MSRVSPGGARTGRALALLAFATWGCAPSPRPLTETDLGVLADAGLRDPAVAAAIESIGGPVERFYGLDDDGAALPAPGVSVPVAAGDVGEVITRLRADLSGLDLGLYHVEQNFGFEPDRVAILVGADPYAFLRLVRVDGINYDLEHEDVIARLRSWDERYGLEYVGAGLDWVSAGFSELPDWDAFAAEVYGFCPDVVDQGTGTVEALAREMRRSRSLYCWWD